MVSGAATRTWWNIDLMSANMAILLENVSGYRLARSLNLDLDTIYHLVMFLDSTVEHNSDLIRAIYRLMGQIPQWLRRFIDVDLRDLTCISIVQNVAHVV